MTAFEKNWQNVAKQPNLTSLGPWKWPLERFNQIHLLTVYEYHPLEDSCINREKVNQTVFEKIASKWKK